MGNINNYKNFLFEKEESKVKGTGKRTVAKVKRIVTGDHVGFDPKVGNKYPLTYLPEEKFNKLVEYWKAGDKNKAAEFLRGIIIKERDAQFKVGAALIMVGATMVKAGFPVEDITPENTSTTDVTPDVTPDLTEVNGVVQKGDGFTQTFNKVSDSNISSDTPGKVFIDTVRDKFGGGDLTQGVDNISGMSKTPGDMPSIWKEIISKINDNPDITCGELFKDKLSGTGEKIGDLLTTKPGGEFTYYK
jgi:hypothetical protein